MLFYSLCKLRRVFSLQHILCARTKWKCKQRPYSVLVLSKWSWHSLVYCRCWWWCRSLGVLKCTQSIFYSKCNKEANFLWCVQLEARQTILPQKLALVFSVLSPYTSSDKCIYAHNSTNARNTYVRLKYNLLNFIYLSIPLCDHFYYYCYRFVAMIAISSEIYPATTLCHAKCVIPLCQSPRWMRWHGNRYAKGNNSRKCLIHRHRQ